MPSMPTGQSRRGNGNGTPWQTVARRAFGFFLAIYATSLITWQHRHLNAQSTDISTLLSLSKDAFLGVAHPPPPATSSSIDADAAAATNRSNVVLSHRPAHLILQNPKLPDWVKQYAAWHGRQRARYLEAKRDNSSEADDVRFLVSRCLRNDKCGGASDRLQDMPYNVMLANRTGRVLLVRWEKPARLEHYMVPPESHGIDWTVPDEMYDMLEGDGNWNLRGKEADESLRIVSVIRRDSAAPIFRKYENDEVGHKIYHEIFRLLFTPSAALADRVGNTMRSLGLIPGEYSSVHLRVKYPVRGIDERTFTFQKHRKDIIKWATNAVNCAAELHPNSTIYVSSDNNDTVGYLVEESHFAQHYRENHPSAVKLVARDYSEEVRHVAFSDHPEADGFENVFEDMTIMGMGRCVAHGVGGYGRLGAALSGGECAVAHRGRNSRVCSDALKRMQ